MRSVGITGLRMAARWMVGFAVGFPLAVSAFSAEPPKPNLPLPAQLMASVEQQYALLKGVRFSCSASTYLSVGGAEDLAKTEEVSVNFDRVGKRIRALRDPALQGSADKGANPVHVEQIALRNKYVNLTEDRKKGAIENLASKAKVSEEDWEQFACQSFYSIVLGYVPFEQGGGYLPDVLRGMTATARPDSIGAIPVAVLEGKSEGCELTLWLDPAIHYQARRIAFQRDPATVKAGAVERFAYEVQTFENVKGYPFPVAFEIRTTKAGGVLQSPFVKSKLAVSAGASLPQRSLVTKVRVKDVDLNPDFTALDFALKRQVPNGTRVFMEDAQHLAFVWEDGEIVPSTDPRMVQPLQDLGFTMDPGSTRFWFFLAQAVLLAALVPLVVFWRLRRERTKARGDGKAQ